MSTRPLHLQSGHNDDDVMMMSKSSNWRCIGCVDMIIIMAAGDAEDAR